MACKVFNPDLENTESLAIEIIDAVGVEQIECIISEAYAHIVIVDFPIISMLDTRFSDRVFRFIANFSRRIPAVVYRYF